MRLGAHKLLTGLFCIDTFFLIYQIDIRYNELLFLIDTCQAASMFKPFYSPNIIGVGSSSVGEDSLSVSHVSVYLACITLHIRDTLYTIVLIVTAESVHVHLG